MKTSSKNWKDKIILNTPQKFIYASFDQPWWEFGRPTMIISPLIKLSENNAPFENLLEDLCLDICLGLEGITKNIGIENPNDKYWKWRGWSIKELLSIFKNKKNRMHKKYPNLYFQTAEVIFRKSSIDNQYEPDISDIKKINIK